MVIFSLALLWVLMLGVCIALFVLARQIGVLHQRIHPVGALLANNILKVGDPAPSLAVSTLQNEPIYLGDTAEDSAPKSTLIFFLSPGCPICKELLPAVKSSAVAEGSWLDVIYASDGVENDHQSFISSHKLPADRYVVSEELGRAFAVNNLPYAVLIDESGRISSMGLVNTQEQMESMFNAHEMGVSSVQEYLQIRR